MPSSPSLPWLSFRESSGVTVVRFTGAALRDEVLIAAFRAHLTRVVAGRQRPLMVLDFSAVEDVSSSALALLVALNRLADRVGGRLALCGVRRHLRELLRQTRLERFFSVYPDQREALGSFGARP